MLKSRNRKNQKLLPPTIESEQISSSLETNEQLLRNLFQNCSDFKIHPIPGNRDPKMMLFYIEGLTDATTVEKVFLKPLIYEGIPNGVDKLNNLPELIEQQLLAVTSINKVSEMRKLVDGILKGKLALLMDGQKNALLADYQGFEQRSVTEPSSEVTIRGPRDGFTESLRVNTTLIRRRIRSTRLKMETLTVGELSQTDVVVAYIEGIAMDSIIEEVRKRVKNIEIDGVLESEYIEEFIEDVPYSPFPQVQNTERPDIVAANLLEGKVAILIDNTPFALIVPMTFWSGLQAVEDYYERFIYTSFIRLVRYVLVYTTIFLPSLYVALTTYHPRLIPTALLISIAAAREGVPFPAIIEALLMEFVFEGLREAGIRLPKAVGSAVSIVGALVVGQAAVQAGIVSTPMVIVVATTGIASFSIPRYNLGAAVRIIRFPMLGLAGIFGLYGIVLGFIALTIHLVNLRSFGVPYFTPVAPQNLQDLKDVFFRMPRWANRFGPFFTFKRRHPRVAPGQKPSPETGGGNS